MQSEKSTNKELLTALIEFQKIVPVIPKNCVNPFFSTGTKKAMYADLATVIDTCKPVLNKCGLVVFQKMGLENGKNILITILAHVSGQTEDSKILLPEIVDPQKLTAAITYLRRTSYLSILGLVADDDDDGNTASQSVAPKESFDKQPVKDSPASEAQLTALKKMYPSANLSGLTKTEAKKMFDDFNKGKK